VDPKALRLPYAFHGIELGLGDGVDDPTRLRVQLTQTATATAEVSAVDEAGRPLFRISSVLTRELKRADPALAEIVHHGLFRVAWEAPGVPPSGEPITVPHPPTGANVIESTRTLIHDTLALLQHRLTDPDFAGTHLTITIPNSLPSLPYAAVAGLVRSVQGEYPGHITLSAAGATDHSPARVPRLVPVTPDTSQPRTWMIDPDRTILITGGTGALGTVLARHLVVAHSARHLVLASRRGLAAPGAPRLLSELTVLGCSVRIVPCDVTDPQAVRRLIESCDHPALGAVIHTAGVLDDGVLIAQTPGRFERVLASKAYAGWTLHEATQGLNLAAFVLYSSASGLLSRPGQANYAAANAFLDALAQHRRALGLPAVSLAWGPWEQEGGMANPSAHGVPGHRGNTGVRALTSAEAMALFDASQYSAEPVLAPILLTPDRQAHADPSSPTPTASPAPGAWRRLLAAHTTPADRRRDLESLIRTELAALVGYQEDDELLADRRFTELGFDSLTSLQARSLLVDRTGVQLPVTIMFENPTLPELAAAIEAELDRRPATN
jgi:hypothetical protein